MKSERDDLAEWGMDIAYQLAHEARQRRILARCEDRIATHADRMRLGTDRATIAI